MTQYDAAARDSVDRQAWRGQRLYTEGAIALAEKRTDDAIRTFRRMDVDADGLPISCAFCLSIALARAYDQANNADSTIAYLERYLATTITFRINPDTWLLGPAHKRLGELYEARGDAKKAAEHYATFVRAVEARGPRPPAQGGGGPDATRAGAAHAAALNKRASHACSQARDPCSERRDACSMRAAHANAETLRRTTAVQKHKPSFTRRSPARGMTASAA